jgi:hypothetical protein
MDQGSPSEQQKGADMSESAEHTATVGNQPNSSTNLNEAPTVDANASGSKKRKKVIAACVYCRRSHMNCDESRPCKRCIKRGIGHLCHDQHQPQSIKANSPLAPTLPSPLPLSSQSNHLDTNEKLAANVISFPNKDSNNTNNDNNNYNLTLSTTANIPADNFMAMPSSATINQLPFFYSEHAGSEFNSLTEFLSMIDDNEMMDSINMTNDPMLQKLEATNYLGSSGNLHLLTQINEVQPQMSKMSQPQLHQLQNQLNQQQRSLQQQYQQTGALLDSNQPRIQSPLIQSHQLAQFPSLASNSATPAATSVPTSGHLTAYKTPNQQNAQLNYTKSPIVQRFQNDHNRNTSIPSSSTTAGQNQNQNQNLNQNLNQPHISDAARDKFFLTAADPTTEISPEERLKQVINAKLEAGLLKPYNYAKGYQRLQTYMDKYMSTSSRSRILKPLSTFRPGFRAIAKTLKDIDLILVEESFERMLLDYDRVFTSMAIPACLWRRTGEIYRGNKEFASLVDVSIEDLKNGKLTIYELMTEESSVNFWEKYGAIAFDKTQKAVLTSCNLRTKDGRKKRNCCFSFTIRRDRYNIPSCIVGNFIPIR